MIRFLYILAAAAIAVLTSCEGRPTVQKYFVEKSEAKDFSAIDLSPNFIKTDSLNLSAEERKALKSLQHINILLFKADGKNGREYEKQTAEVSDLLKTDDYEELIKVNHDNGGASISTKGEGEHVDEFVVYLKESSSGFGLIRVTGEDITPNNVMTIASILQKAPVDAAQLKPLKELVESGMKR